MAQDVDGAFWRIPPVEGQVRTEDPPHHSGIERGLQTMESMVQPGELENQSKVRQTRDEIRAAVQRELRALRQLFRERVAPVRRFVSEQQPEEPLHGDTVLAEEVHFVIEHE